MDAPKFILPFNQNIGNGILEVIRQQLNYCLYAIVLKGDIHQNVHLIRQTTKHIRAYLLLIKPKDTKKLGIKNDNAYTKIARSLAHIRNLHVQYELFKKSSENLNIYNTPLFCQIHSFFCLALQTEMTRLKLGEVIENIYLEFEQEVKYLEKVTYLINHESVYNNLNKIKKKAKHHYRKLSLKDKPKEFHKLRVWVKYLSIQLSLFRADYLESPDKLDLANLSKLAHLLGIEHDYNELIKALDSLSEVRMSSKYTITLRPYLEQETFKIREKIKKLGNNLFRK
jgi:hypothetical protein